MVKFFYLSREALLKGKSLYGLPPCTNLLTPAHFYIGNIILFCYKASYLNEEVYSTETSPSVGVPCLAFALYTYSQECRADDLPADSPVDVGNVTQHLMNVALKVVQTYSEISVSTLISLSLTPLGKISLSVFLSIYLQPSLTFVSATISSTFFNKCWECGPTSYE